MYFKRIQFFLLYFDDMNTSRVELQSDSNLPAHHNRVKQIGHREICIIFLICRLRLFKANVKFQLKSISIV